MSQATEQIALQYANGAANKKVWSDIIFNVKAYGAKGNGTSDDTAEIQKTIDAASVSGGIVYFPPGTYYVTNALTITKPGLVFKGSGSELTIINVTSSFNLSALGVIILASGEPGAQLEDFKISFEQPDTAVRSELISYPTAIYAQDQPRFKIERVKIVRCTVGVDMSGNSGGVVITDLQMSCFSTGIYLNGALDSVKLDKIHIWPFDLTSSQTNITYDPADTVGIIAGRVDDLHITNSLFFVGTGLKMGSGGGGGTFGEISNTDFDAHNGIVMEDGSMVVAGCTFTCSDAMYQAVKQTGGSLVMSGCSFVKGYNSILPLVQVIGTIGYLAGTITTIVGSIFNTLGGDVSSIDISTGGELSVTGCHFRRYPDISYTNPTMHVAASARATIIGNRTFDKGAGTGTFIKVDTDDWHRVAYNTPIGWTISTPAAVNGIYTPN